MILSSRCRYCSSVARSLPHTWRNSIPCFLKVRRIHFVGSVLVIRRRSRMSWGVNRPPRTAVMGRPGGGRALSTSESATWLVVTAAMLRGRFTLLPNDVIDAVPAMGALACGSGGTTATDRLAAPGAGSEFDMRETRLSAYTGLRPSTRRQPETRARAASTKSSGRPSCSRMNKAPVRIIGALPVIAKRVASAHETASTSCPAYAQ